MKIILSIGLLLLATYATAQDTRKIAITANEFFKNKLTQSKLPGSPFLTRFAPVQVQKTVTTTYNMPVLKLEVEQQLMGNNGKGLNILITQPYKMPVLSPDGSVHLDMPVVGKEAVAK